MSLFKYITHEDGEQDPPDDGPATLNQVKTAKSDAILSQQELFCISMDLRLKQLLIELLNKPAPKAKEFFKLDSDQLVEMSDHSRQEICKMLDSQDLITFSHAHH
jgi:hypothetical protein